MFLNSDSNMMILILAFLITFPQKQYYLTQNVNGMSQISTPCFFLYNAWILYLKLSM